ncbi:MAG TPA: AAA family ATPase [Gaiellales bacterium]
MTSPDHGALLERSAQLALFAERLAAVRRDRRGRLVLVSGEAGIGKTALLRAFCDAPLPVRVLWGGCDALHTPRALGPFVDIAEQTGGELAAVLAQGAAPTEVAVALASELRRTPAVLVLEDLHWADEATLDVIRLLARRMLQAPALVLATSRTDQLGSAHPLRLALGELPADAVERVALAPLSLAAVEQLADATDVDAAELHRSTAGNPFFVSEVLATEGGDVPETVRDAVLARAARLDDDARAVLEAVAVEPSRVELWLLEALVEDVRAGLDACLGSGMLVSERSTVGFRHEIARVVIEEALPPSRRALLARRALDALTAAIGRRPDLARLAHHAEAADDAGAVLHFATAAGERAAALGSHREAAAQLERAVRYSASLPRAQRAHLLERFAYECYLTDRMGDSSDARLLALEEHRTSGDRVREGDCHRWLSRLAWFAGENGRADSEAQLAIDLLQPLGPRRELAMAYSNMAQLRMLTADEAGAVSWGNRAIAMAEELGELEILAHALNNVGTAEMRVDVPGGFEKLQRSLAIAVEHDLQEHVARAFTNLASAPLDHRDYARSGPYLDAGIAYCLQRDLDAWTLYMVGYRARGELDQGQWETAEASAREVLDLGRAPSPTHVAPLVVTGRLLARRGEDGVWAALDEALDIAAGAGEIQRVGLVANARAEARWLAGDDDAIQVETAAALALALMRDERWIAGELFLWRRRAGNPEQPAPGTVAEPFALELAGDADGAAAAWSAIGCPYEAALALAHSSSEQSQRRALAELQRLGARPAAARVARRLRESGARDVRKGPRSSTRENPGGLTARELEVLVLVAEGLRNAEIAARLFASERTVAHHVSAILRKLGVASRGQASAEAARLGIVER